VKDKQELIKIIKAAPDDADLNYLDVSLITDMRELFKNTSFNGKIDAWDMSNVTSTSEMFSRSQFNQEIGNWDISNVTSMREMFYGSPFNQAIESWDTSKIIQRIIWVICSKREGKYPRVKKSTIRSR
jgi:hypothetical protein